MRVRAAGVNPVDAYIRTRHLRAQAAAAVHAWLRRRRRNRSGRRGRQADSSAGDRVYIAGIGDTVAGAGTYAEHALCAPTSFIGCRRASSFAQGAALGVPYAHRVPRAVPARAAHARRNGARARRHRRRRDRRGRARARARPARDRQRRHRQAAWQAVREHGADVVVNHTDAGLPRRDHEARPAAAASTSIVEMAAHINLDKDLVAARAAVDASSSSATAAASRSTRGRRWAATRRFSA